MHLKLQRNRENETKLRESQEVKVSSTKIDKVAKAGAAKDATALNHLEGILTADPSSSCLEPKRKGNINASLPLSKKENINLLENYLETETSLKTLPLLQQLVQQRMLLPLLSRCAMQYLKS